MSQNSFSSYLSRIFFTFPKSKLFKIIESFKQIYRVDLKDYIEARFMKIVIHSLALLIDSINKAYQFTFIYLSIQESWQI